MLLDLRTLDDATHFQTPLCILGAGAAGLTLARRLLDRGWPVLLVESGGLDYEAPVQALAEGRVVGWPYYDLDSVNLRMLGGTTAIWGGRCAQLDPIDFRGRSWVPHSGWPFGHEALQSYYREALALFQVAAPDQARAEWHKHHPALRAVEGNDLALGFWSMDTAAARFAAPRLGDLLNHPKCRVLIHATATHLALAADGRSISRVDLRDVYGRRATVAAGHVVLALGGIENARLLLASNDVAANGIGNDRDQVGRYFMEHPHARGGKIVGPGIMRLLDALGRRRMVNGTTHAPLMRLSESAQERLGALNSALTLGLRRPELARQAWVIGTFRKLKHELDSNTRNRALWRVAKDTVRRLDRLVFPLRPWWSVRTGHGEVAIVLRAEQAPNPDSRILLDRDTDAVGLRRIRLDWRLGAQDKHSVACLLACFDAALRTAGLGKAVKAGWLDDPDVPWRSDPNISAQHIGGYHHMGTTRMADDPARGVVDAHGRVHGLANLHVVGSSTFPTGGWANPTLTIAALALRTADHFGRFDQ